MGLFVTASSGTVHWNSYSVSVSSGISYSATSHLGNALNIKLGPKTTSHAATIYVTGITFTTTSASGSVAISPKLHTGAATVTFSPSSATDATILPTPPNAPHVTVIAASQPTVSAGTTTVAVGDWTLTMSGSSTTGSGWNAGASLTVTVAPPSGSNCAGSAYLYFAGVPTVTVDSSTGTGASPTVSGSLSYSGPCSSAQPNELELSFTKADYFSTTGSVTITVSGVRYAVGATATAIGTGAVGVSGSFSVTGSTPFSAVDASRASNAVVGAPQGSGETQPTPSGTSTSQSGTRFVIKANTPPVTVVQDAYDAPISPIEVLGSTTSQVPAGFVCATLSSGAFDTATNPTVAVISGNGAVGATATYQSAGPTGAGTVEFQVTKPSTVRGGYSVSGLAVDAPTRVGVVGLKVTIGSSASCTQDLVLAGSATVYTVAATPVTRIYGTTADATAAAELEHQFDAQATACPGRPGARPVVLATDGRFPDALASAYLASTLGTGELLTPPGALSAATANAIRIEGITEVYIVGGPLAVSTAVAQHLESTLAYNCGGSTPLTSAGPVHIGVTRIAGTTQYDTAQWIAEYPAAGDVGTLDVAGAYGGTNPTGGAGRYNDTAGTGTPAPGTATTLPTAILATGTTFQDAESASALSYADRLPILLTPPTALAPQAASAISNLGIRQVVVMGGPLAVSNGVVSSLKSLGLSVLRIAGKSASDTSVELADFEMGPTAGRLGAGWSGSGGVTVARGDFFTDGLAGAVVAAGGGRAPGHTPEPLLLCTGPSTVGESLSAFLYSAGRTGIDGNAADRVLALTILGGPEAVNPSAVSTMVADL